MRAQSVLPAVFGLMMTTAALADSYSAQFINNSSFYLPLSASSSTQHLVLPGSDFNQQPPSDCDVYSRNDFCVIKPGVTKVSYSGGAGQLSIGSLHSNLGIVLQYDNNYQYAVPALSDGVGSRVIDSQHPDYFISANAAPASTNLFDMLSCFKVTPNSPNPGDMTIDPVVCPNFPGDQGNEMNASLALPIEVKPFSASSEDKITLTYANLYLPFLSDNMTLTVNAPDDAPFEIAPIGSDGGPSDWSKTVSCPITVTYAYKTATSWQTNPVQGECSFYIRYDKPRQDTVSYLMVTSVDNFVNATIGVTVKALDSINQNGSSTNNGSFYDHSWQSDKAF